MGFIARGINVKAQRTDSSRLGLAPWATGVILGEVGEDEEALFVIEALEQHIHVIPEDFVAIPFVEEHALLTEALSNEFCDRPNLVAVGASKRERYIEAERFSEV